jgi:hypothetical protein
MDYKFLDKVLEQMLSETIIDRNKIDTPFYILLIHSTLHYTPIVLMLSPFIDHCRDVYGLNEQETEYVWDKYRDIIYNKIK